MCTTTRHINKPQIPQLYIYGNIPNIYEKYHKYIHDNTTNKHGSTLRQYGKHKRAYFFDIPIQMLLTSSIKWNLLHKNWLSPVFSFLYC